MALRRMEVHKTVQAPMMWWAAQVRFRGMHFTSLIVNSLICKNVGNTYLKSSMKHIFKVSLIKSPINVRFPLKFEGLEIQVVTNA